MPDPLALAEIELRLALLPPMSRGTHFVGPSSGPALHAQRLVELWKAEDEVSLAEAFRLLDVPAVEGVVMRTLGAGNGESSDPRYWQFPSFEGLLPLLREHAWQEILAGSLLLDAIKGVRGKRRRAVLVTELPRLTPDWQLSRLCLGARDEFIDVRVRRAPAEPVKKAWREQQPDESKLKGAMEKIAQGYPPGARPSFSEIWAGLKAELNQEDLPRRTAEDALKNYAPHLRGRRGIRSSKGKSPG